jgi:hypothetical protein
LAPAITERVVTLTQTAPSDETTHWTTAAMAAQVGSQRELGPAHLAQPWPAAAPGAAIETLQRSAVRRQASKVRDIVGLSVDPPAHAMVLSLEEKRSHG